MAKYEKSPNYKGVYWREVKRLDGSGNERMYYIIYRRGGRDGQRFEDRLGRASQDWSEFKAHKERVARINGKQSNAERRESQKKERLLGSGPLTFGRLWELYQEHNKDKASINPDTSNYNNHLDKRLGKKPVSEISTSDIVFIRKKMEGKGLAAQTVKHALGQIRRIIGYGVKLGLCVMPASLVFDMPKVDNLKTETMTKAQLAAYLKALDEEADQDAAALLRLDLVTGIRKSALFALRWNDLDFEKDVITLRGAYAKNGKTSHIPMSKSAKAILLSINRQGEFVFPGKDGGMRKEYRRIAKRVREKAGLPKDFRPLHGLRHVFASELASSGESLYTISKALTHESPSMANRYAHFTDEALRRASNVANALAGKFAGDKE